MVIPLQELQMYRNFDELVQDVISLAKEVLPDKLIYLSAFSDHQQIILKLSNQQTNILLNEGMVINLNETVCNRIDFEGKRPLVYEDISKEAISCDLKELLMDVHINAYLGIPISLMNGKKFGTLCAAHDQASQFDPKSIHMLQRIARMFSYYLELERIAYHDALTDLYNRQFLYKFFGEFSKKGGSLYYLDLDGFKQVNDQYGHDAGDRVLKEVGFRLNDLVKGHENAFATRLGGDEFVLVLPGVTDNEEISKIAEQLLAILNAWDHGYQLSTSIGITAFPPNGQQLLESLLKEADVALYRAKADGRSTYRIS